MNDKLSKSEYIRRHGAVCPYCSLRAVEEQEIEKGAKGKLLRQVSCQECGAAWTEVYTLTDVRYEEDQEG